MLDLVGAILIVTGIVLVCRLCLGLRLLTALTVAITAGCFITGLLLYVGGGLEDFDTDGIAERQMIFTIFTLLMFAFLFIHLIVSSYREYRRHAPNPVA
jgi:hypothetical protein